MSVREGHKTPLPYSADPAWKGLESELARTLSQLGEGEWQYLILSDQRTTRYVQFAVHAESALRAEAVSSDFLSEDHELGKAEEATLEALGWRSPAASPAGSSEPPRRPGNYYRTFERPVDFLEVARLAIETMRDVYQTPYPARLDYLAFERGGAGIIVPGLQLVRRRPAPSPKPEPRPCGPRMRRRSAGSTARAERSRGS